MKKQKRILNKNILFTVALLLFLGMGCQKETPSPGMKQHGQRNQENKPKTLPKFSAVDLKGKRIDSSDFKGRYLFVQFIDSGKVDDVDLLQQVYLKWIDEGLDIVAVPLKIDEFQAQVGIDPNEVTVLPAVYQQMKKIFEAPSCCETFYLFDRSGWLVKSGFNQLGYDEGIKTELNRELKQTAFDISTLIGENENIKDIPWLSQCHKFLETETKDYYLVSLMTSFCSGCYSGSLTEKLAATQRSYKNRLEVLSIVPDDFSDTDLENLKSVFNIPFRVERADRLLKEEWQYRIDQFRESDLTNIIFLVDKSGTIVRVANNDPLRQRDFFIFTKKLLKSGAGGKP